MNARLRATLLRCSSASPGMTNPALKAERLDPIKAVGDTTSGASPTVLGRDRQTSDADLVALAKADHQLAIDIRRKDVGPSSSELADEQASDAFFAELSQVKNVLSLERKAG